MIKRITLTIEEDLHLQFQKLTSEKGSNVSKEVSQFMQQELNGRDNSIQKLFDSIEDLTDRISAIEENSMGDGFGD